MVCQQVESNPGPREQGSVTADTESRYTYICTPLRNPNHFWSRNHFQVCLDLFASDSNSSRSPSYLLTASPLPINSCVCFEPVHLREISRKRMLPNSERRLFVSKRGSDLNSRQTFRCTFGQKNALAAWHSGIAHAYGTDDTGSNLGIRK
jgi:hypothetical protein